MRQRTRRYNKKRSIGQRVTALLLSCIMLILSVPVSAFAGNTELLLNGDFEGYETDEALEGWNADGDVSEKTELLGLNSYMSLCGGDALASLQSDSLQAESEKHYKVSFDVRAQEDAIFRAKILQYCGNSESSAGEIMIPVSELDDDWEEVSYVFQTAADVDGLSVYFENSAGIIDIDNVSVKKTTKESVYIAQGEAVEIQNGDFEQGLESWNVVDSICTKSTDDAFSGKAIVFADFDGVVFASQEQIELQSDATYELHYYVKAVNAQGIASSVSLTVSEDGNYREIKPYVLDGNSSANGWQEVTVQFTTGEIGGTATIKLNVEGEGADEAAVVSFDEISLTRLVSNKLRTAALLAASNNLYTNGNFVLSNSVQIGDKDFDMKTAFADQRLSWPNKAGATAALTWTVESDTTYGNVLKVTGKEGTAAGYWLYHDIAWEAEKTYEISYMAKTGNEAVTGFYTRINADGKSNLATASSTMPPSSTYIAGNTIDGWNKFSFEFTPSTGTAGQFAFWFDLRSAQQTVYLANVSVTEKAMETKPTETVGENLFTNGEFVLSGAVAAGTENFDLKTGFSDQKLAWGNNANALSQLTWEVETDTTYGNVFTVTGKAGSTGGHSLLQNIAWEAGKTYVISYVAKTGTVAPNQFYPRINADKTYIPSTSNPSTPPPFSTNLSHKSVTEWTSYSFEFTAPTTTNGAFGFVYVLNSAEQTVSIADVKVMEKAEVPKRLNNGDFSEGVTGWEGIRLEQLSDGTVGGAESGKVLVTTGNQTIWHEAFTEALEVGTKYTLTFRARNNALSGTGLGSVYLTKKDGSGKAAEISLTASNEVWQKYSIDYVAEEGFEFPKLCMDLKNSDVTYTFADFSFEEYEPIIANGNFTKGADGMENWTVEWMGGNANGGTSKIVDDPTYGKVMKITKPKADTNGTDLRYATLSEPLELGKVYRISYMVKASGTTENDAKIFTMLRPEIIGNGSYASTRIYGTNGQWQQVSFEWTPTAGWEKLNFWIRMEQRVNSSFDLIEYYIADVKIEPTGEEAKGDIGISNGSFLEAVGNYPKDWGLLVGTGATASTATAAQGKEDKGITNVKKTGTGLAGVSTLASTYAGVNNQLSFWLKADQSAREALELRATYYQDKQRSAIVGQEMLSFTIDNTDEWQYVLTNFSAPDGAEYVDISLYMKESATAGTIALDNVLISLNEEAERNFNFEVGSDTPISWVAAGAGTFSRSKESYDGSYAAKISNNTGTTSLESTKFAVEGGTDYELSYWVKTEADYDFYVDATVRQMKEDGNYAYSTVYDNKSPYTKQSSTISFPWTFRTFGSTEWRLVRMYFTTAEDAAQAYLHIDFSGTADVILLDNIAVLQRENAANMDFEDVDENGCPSGWYLTGGRDTIAELKSDSTYYHSGNKSLYINVNGSAREQQIISSHQIPITTESDTRVFETSFWVASRNADIKSIRCDLWFYNEHGIKIYTASIGVTDPSIKGLLKTLNSGDEVTEWSQVFTRVAIPKSAASVSLVFTMTQGAAEVWIDDLFFDQVESDDKIVAAHNDLHAVDQDGNLSGWEAEGNATLVQGKETDNSGERTYGKLTVSDGGGAMKYRTNTTGTGYGYALAITYRSDYALDLHTKFYDYQENEYTGVAKSYTLAASTEWREEIISYTAPSATFTDYIIGMENSGEFEVAQIILYQTSRPSTKMAWKGKWISYREDFRFCEEYAHSYYRKTFTLEDKATYAPLQITADDKFAIYVNGEQVFSNIDDSTAGWATISTLDLVPYLKKGKNVIGIDVYNQGAYSALLFDGMWELANGDSFDCMSDKDTKALGETPFNDESWAAVNFDDSSWNKSIELGNVPMNPWGDLSYDSSLYIDNLIEVKPAEGEGDLVNDLVYDFAIQIKMKNKITSQLPLNLMLWRKNSTESICSLSATLMDHTDMKEWPVDKWFTVKMRVELPDYIEDGNYSLQLSDTYFAITNEDIFDNRFISFKVVNDYVPSELVTKVENINGTPTFTINGEPIPAFYFTTSFTNYTSGLDTLANSGIETYVNFSTILGKYENTPGLWNENGSIDYQYLDTNINTILSASPDANMIVSIGMYAPEWWLEQNPGEAAATSDINGRITTSAIASFGSEKWNEASSEVLKQIISHMREQSYYSRIAGIRILAGNTYEFITYGSQSEVDIPDYSDAALQFFRKWMKEKYGTIEKLQEAWGDDTISSFDAIELPSFKEMKESGNSGMLYNPATQQRQIDFRMLLGEMTADAVLQWAQAAKEATDYKLAVGAYYGYLFMGGNWSSLGAEHSVYDRVLSSEYLDFFASPVGYNERQLGETIYTQSVADSMRAYGKLYIAEQDNRTVLNSQFAGGAWETSRDDAIGQTHTMEDTLLQEKRDAVFNITNGNGQWLLDMLGGWINDDQMYEFTRDLNDEFNFSNYIQKDTVNDVALIMADTNGTYLKASEPTDGDGVLGSQTTVAQYMYTYHRKQLLKMGAGYDTYALSTLVDGKMPKHKINVFFSPYVLSEEERNAIDQYCKSDGQINIFLYLSG